MDCQCVTPDTEYSRRSKGYLDGTLDDLHFCSDESKPYSLDLGNSEIYVCRDYRCGTKACAEDEIPDESRRTCIKKAVCQPNEIYVREGNTCACDSGAHWAGDVGACQCQGGYVLVNGRCVESVEPTCDLSKEVYDAFLNICRCDDSRHFTGVAGHCACETHYVPTDAGCALLQTCGEYEDYLPETNTCMCAEGYVRIGSSCVPESHCSGSTHAKLDEASRTCTCIDGTVPVLGWCAKTGDVVPFGRYRQSDVEDRQDDLMWKILEITNDDVLLITENVLEQRIYHPESPEIPQEELVVTWEQSDIRAYLNGLTASENLSGTDYFRKGFIDVAFYADERSLIKKVRNTNPDSPEEWAEDLKATPGGNDTEDWIFLLSYDEVLKYLPTYASRVASPTAYAMNRSAEYGNKLHVCEVTCVVKEETYEETCSSAVCKEDGSKVQVCSQILCGSMWWLRSPGASSMQAAHVFTSGELDGTKRVSNAMPGLRPALYIHRDL